MNRRFFEIAEQVTLLADSSKFAAQAIYRVAPLERIAGIIMRRALSLLREPRQ
jgi:DeoR/GlpR family transcriptional regulator of sugar metabolism